MRLYGLLSSLSYYFHILLGKLLGPSHVVSYLRNPNPSITIRLLRAFGAKIGEGTTIKRSIFCDNVYEDQDSTGDFSHLTIGNNCYIGDCVYVDLADELVIKNDVVVAGHVSFITHADCNRSKDLSVLFPRKHAQIIVNEGSWIAFGTTVLQGITIGQRAVIAAHSLVTKDVDEWSVWGGIPAVKMKELN